jgi:hypothetical protein
MKRRTRCRGISQLSILLGVFPVQPRRSRYRLDTLRVGLRATCDHLLANKNNQESRNTIRVQRRGQVSRESAFQERFSAATLREIKWVRIVIPVNRVE